MGWMVDDHEDLLAGRRPLRCSRRGACSRSARKGEVRSENDEEEDLVNLVLAWGSIPIAEHDLSLVILVTCPSRTNSLMFWTSRSTLVMVAHLNSFGSSASGCARPQGMRLSSSRRWRGVVLLAKHLGDLDYEVCAEDGPNHFCP